MHHVHPSNFHSMLQALAFCSTVVDEMKAVVGTDSMKEFISKVEGGTATCELLAYTLCEEAVRVYNSWVKYRGTKDLREQLHRVSVDDGKSIPAFMMPTLKDAKADVAST